MKKILLFLIPFIFIFSSCDFLNKIKENDSYVENIEFKSGKYILYEGEAEVCYVTASPSDSFEWYETEYSIEDSSIISFQDCTDHYCIIKANKEGTSIITCKLGNKTGKTVVTVRKKGN